jgi:hypothetical protein
MADNPLSKGTRVVKTNSQEGDTHRDGEFAQVVQAIGPALPESGAPGTYGYFVVWDSHPGIPVFIAGSRLRVAPQPGTS